MRTIDLVANSAPAGVTAALLGVRRCTCRAISGFIPPATVN